MFNEFMFGMKTDIRFGRGLVSAVGDIAKEYGAKKIMLVADKGIRATGLPDKVAEFLINSKIEVVHFDKIVPNPRISDCEAGAKIGTNEMVDTVVAVGGGSSIDTAKAIAGMLGHATTDFNVIKYPNPYTNDPIPLIAIPTTAGTGSEVTTCGVITDEVKHEKVYCYDSKCAATVTICDPEVLMNLPTPIAASTGLDALTHAIEGYVAKCTSPITEAFGLYAITLLAENFRKYIFDRDLDSCEGIMIGSMMAGLSFGYSDTCAVHSIAETIGGQYDTPHGVANAIFLADVSEYNIPADVRKYVNVAKAMGVKDFGLTDNEFAHAGVKEIRRLVSDLGIPKFSQLDKIDAKDFELLAERCTTHISNPDNPRFLSKEEFLMLLNKAYNA